MGQEVWLEAPHDDPLISDVFVFIEYFTYILLKSRKSCYFCLLIYLCLTVKTLPTVGDAV